MIDSLMDLRMERVYESQSVSVPRFKVYRRVGMYHFVIGIEVSGRLSDQIAEFTGSFFKKIDHGVNDPAMIEWMGKEIEEHLASLKPWHDDQKDAWYARGESPFRESLPEDDDDVWGETRWYELKKHALQSRYGHREGLFLVNRIAKIHRKNTDQCKDNERIAIESSKQEMAIYKDRWSHGCCGFSDTKLEFYDYDTGNKKVFWYGFNYGH